MKLVLEIRAHADDDHVTHQVVERFPVALGRAFDNDVILGDPHVSPRHLRLELEAGEFFIRDLDSENGMTVNGVHRQGGSVRVRSGDAVKVGQTEVRLFAPEHQVPAAQRLQKASGLFLALSRSPVMWASFALMLAALSGWGYLSFWTAEPDIMVAGIGALAIFGVLLWAALWAVTGRLVRRKAHFKSHVAMISLFLTAQALSYYVAAYIDFLSNENWFSWLSGAALDGLLLALLLYGSLTQATLMTHKRRRSSAVFLSAGLVLAGLALNFIGNQSFRQAPAYPATLQPYLARAAWADTLDGYMADNAALFSGLKVKN